MGNQKMCCEKEFIDSGLQIDVSLIREAPLKKKTCINSNLKSSKVEFTFFKKHLTYHFKKIFSKIESFHYPQINSQAQ